jgi:membrane associated rhomboid family serine protease
MKMAPHPFGSAAEALVYPTLLLSFMWTIYWLELVSGKSMIALGVHPQHWSSWPGLFFMPLLHSPSDLAHIVNNSIPTFLLTAALIYYYRIIARRVFLMSWFGTGLFILLLAPDDGGVHIGMSGVLYALFGFIFVSGFIRNFRPLQVISLFVVFIYGSMIWGIFPLKENVSWEGHFSGLIIGVFLAIWFRKEGPKRPKYQYEIEQELGIEPPDLEGMWLAKQEEQREIQAQLEAQQQALEQLQKNAWQVVYHIRPTNPISPPKSSDEIDPSVSQNHESHDSNL